MMMANNSNATKQYQVHLLSLPQRAVLLVPRMPKPVPAGELPG